MATAPQQLWFLMHVQKALAQSPRQTAREFGGRTSSHSRGAQSEMGKDTGLQTPCLVNQTSEQS